MQTESIQREMSNTIAKNSFLQNIAILFFDSFLEIL